MRIARATSIIVAISAFVVSAEGLTRAEPATDPLDDAILIVRPGPMDYIVPVKRLWDCFARSASKSEVIARTEIESPTTQKNIKVSIRNIDGQVAELFFALDNNKALLFRIATPDGVLRKHDTIADLIAETCHFSSQ